MNLQGFNKNLKVSYGTKHTKSEEDFDVFESILTGALRWNQYTLADGELVTSHSKFARIPTLVWTNRVTARTLGSTTVKNVKH